MARTKSSRGKEPFQMRSGNSTPYPFLGKIVGGAVGAIKNMLPGGGGNNSGSGDAGDMNTKIDEIHATLVGNEGSLGGSIGAGVGEGRTLAEAAKQGAMPKKTHMYTHADSANPTVKETDPNTGKRHYHAAKTESQLPKKP